MHDLAHLQKNANHISPAAGGKYKTQIKKLIFIFEEACKQLFTECLSSSKVQLFRFSTHKSHTNFFPKEV